jgi:pyrimidine deaminase RibD-like protein
MAASSEGRVQMAPLVGVVLDADQVVAEAVEKSHSLEHAGRVAGVRREEVAELDGMAVIHVIQY